MNVELQLQPHHSLFVSPNVLVFHSDRGDAEQPGLRGPRLRDAHVERPGPRARLPLLVALVAGASRPVLRPLAPSRQHDGGQRRRPARTGSRTGASPSTSAGKRCWPAGSPPAWARASSSCAWPERAPWSPVPARSSAGRSRGAERSRRRDRVRALRNPFFAASRLAALPCVVELAAIVSKSGRVILPPLFPIRDRLPTRLFPFVNYALIAREHRRLRPADDGGDRHGGHPRRSSRARGRSCPRTSSTTRCRRRDGVHEHVHARDAWRTSAATCSSSGSSATTSRTRWGTCATSLFYLLGGVCAAAAQTLADPTSLSRWSARRAPSRRCSRRTGFSTRARPSPSSTRSSSLWFFFGLFLHLPGVARHRRVLHRQPLDALTNNAQGGVAFMAHVGGFVGGRVPAPALHGRARADRRLRAVAARGPTGAGDPQRLVIAADDHSARRSMRPLSIATRAEP